MRVVASWARWAGVLLVGFVATGQSSALSQESMPTELLGGIVKVKTSGQQGSGVIVDIDNEWILVLTAAHVVVGDPHPQVDFFQQRGESFASTVLEGSELSNDLDGLALLRIRYEQRVPGSIRSLPLLQNSVGPGAGEEIWVLSIPRLVNNWTPLRGNVVVRRGRELTVDARAGDGSSGGAIMQDGQVVGLVQRVDQFVRGNPASSVQVFLNGMGLSLSSSIGREKDGSVMVKIIGGSFQRGINERQRKIFLELCQKERQVKKCKEYLTDIYWLPEIVNVPTFFIDKFEVTRERYNQFLLDSGYERSDFLGKEEVHADYPMSPVSYFDAETFCQWEGKRLPTDVEWEKAARGTDGRLFPWGNDPPTKNHAQVVSQKEFLDFLRDDSQPINLDTIVSSVGSFPLGTSPYGVLDMVGNVKEWVRIVDDRAIDIELFSEVEVEKSLQGVKGGDALDYLVGDFLVFHSEFVKTDQRDALIGFRCARDFD